MPQKSGHDIHDRDEIFQKPHKVC